MRQFASFLRQLCVIVCLAPCAQANDYAAEFELIAAAGKEFVVDLLAQYDAVTQDEVADSEQLSQLETPVVEAEPPTEVVWVTLDEALASGRPVWIHISGKNCGPCRIEAGFFLDPRVIIAAREFACVHLDSADPEAKPYVSGLVPKDVVLVDGDRRNYTGCPKDALELAARLATVSRDAPQALTDYSVRILVDRNDGTSFYGSGVHVLYGGSTYVVTNYHVISEAGANGTIYAMPDADTKLVATVDEVDTLYDVAVLEVEGLTGGATVVKFSPGKTYHSAGFRGDGVRHSHRLFPKLWRGQKPREGSGRWSWVTFDAPVCKGDSGGGVFNEAGEVVGVVWGSYSDESWATVGNPFRAALDKALED